ncbi:GGDEF domain-containing protein [bacterium]|nr:GGDEF domain-containing protein [bacterium]
MKEKDKNKDKANPINKNDGKRTEKKTKEEEKLESALSRLDQRETEIQAFMNAAKAVLEKRDFKSAAREIFDNCKNLIGGDSGYVALLSKDGEENELLFLDQGPHSCNVDPTLPMPIRGLRSEVYKSGVAQYLNNFNQSSYMKFMPQGHVDLKNVLFSPLNLEGKTVGLLGIANKPGGFNENDAKLAGTFGELAAIALLNSRTIDRLRGLHGAVDILQKCETEDEICSQALKVVQEIVSFDFCVFYCLSGHTLVPKSMAPENFSHLPGSYSKGEGIVGKTMEKGKSLLENNGKGKEKDPIMREDFKSYISTPIGKLGALQIFSHQKETFSQQDLELVEILAGHLREEIKRIRVEEKLKEQAIHDSLTGLNNRRYFDQIIKKELARARRYNHALCFFMIDVDRFKEINDRFSHLTGDRVLYEVAELLIENIRSTDIIVRYGGDEFLIFMPETGREAGQVIGRIRKSVERWNRKQKLIDFPLSLSIGNAYWEPEEDKGVDQILREADKKMYEDKEKHK